MEVIKELFKSKKFVASLVGVIVVVVDKTVGLQLPEDTVTQVVALLAAYVVGQGLADHGKEKAKVEATAPPKVIVNKVEQ